MFPGIMFWFFLLFLEKEKLITFLSQRKIVQAFIEKELSLKRSIQRDIKRKKYMEEPIQKCLKVKDFLLFNGIRPIYTNDEHQECNEM